MVCCGEKFLTEFPQRGHLKQHVICIQCVARYLKNKIMDEGVTRIRCIDAACEIPLEYNDIERHTNKTVFTRYILVYGV